MLDLGFIHDLRKIAKLLGSPRQTLLFSATMPKLVSELSKSYQTNPARVEVSPPGKAADKVTQEVHYVLSGGKTQLLKDMLSNNPDDLSLVFSRTKHGAEKLMKHLVASGFAAASIHGNKSQGQRDRALKGFRNGDIRILVATDVAARGIDIPGVSHVYNYNLPEVPENYVHRIGRTARAGRKGKAVAFCSPDERKLLVQIERLMKIEIPVLGSDGSENLPVEGDGLPSRRGRGNRGGSRTGSGKPKKKTGGGAGHKKHPRRGGTAGGEGREERQATAKPKGSPRSKPSSKPKTQRSRKSSGGNPSSSRPPQGRDGAKRRQTKRPSR